MRISHIKNRIEQQLALSDIIFQAIDSFNRIAYTDMTTRLINVRVTALKEHWDKFSIIHDAIVMAIGHLSADDKQLIREHSYFCDNIHAQTYEHYLDSID